MNLSVECKTMERTNKNLVIIELVISNPQRLSNAKRWRCLRISHGFLFIHYF